MIELLILTTLFFGPCHGYEIKKMFPGIKINNNTLYPLLKKLVTGGYVKMDLQEQINKPAKKVYDLTETGKARLFELISDFDDDDASSDDEFYIRVAFFQFLDSDIIRNILLKRKEHLNDIYSQQKLMTILECFPDKAFDILYLKNYSESKIRTEIMFVDTLMEKYNVKEN